MKFHLTVNADGVVSLWDTRQKAATATDETYVEMELTSLQRDQVLRAQADAVTKNNRDPQEGSEPLVF